MSPVNHIARGFLSVTIALICACGSPDKDRFEKSGIEAHTRVDDQLRPLHERWIFAGMLKGLSSSEHFVLEALFMNAEGALTLHSHFNGFGWRDGVRITFRRAASGDHLEITVPGYATRVEYLPKDFISPDGRLHARIEIENAGLAGVRVLVWKYGIAAKGGAESPRPFISEANAEFDSATKGWTFTDHGRGAKWGLEFEDVRILKIHREAPYVE